MKTVDWNKTEAHAKRLSEDELDYVIKDCIKARDASKGWNPENENYYQDLASTYADEQRRRRIK